MKKQYLFWSQLVITLSVSFALWILLMWEHFHGGVPSHHILDRADMPSISNWWGGLVLPLLTWFSLGRIHKRVLTFVNDQPVEENYPKSVILGFVGALLFGILLSLFFMMGHSNIPPYMILALIPLALFIPIYRAEYLLGFVLGMTYTFGVLLPTVFGLLLILIFAGLYNVVRPLIISISSRIFNPIKNLKGLG